MNSLIAATTRLSRIAVLTLALAPVADVRAAMSYETFSQCVDSLGGIGEFNAPSAKAGSACQFNSVNEKHSANGDASVVVGLGTRRVGIDSTASGRLALQEVPGAIVVAAGGSGTLTELLNISATGNSGQVVTAGRMQVDLLASGSVKVSGSGPYYDPPLSFATLTYNVNVSNSLGVFDSIELSGPGDRMASAPLSLLVQWEIGEFVSLTMSVAAQTAMQLKDSGAVNAQVHFGNSLDWLGVRNVTDLAGNPVASFSLTSSSTGADWGTYVPAVPENEAWAMMLTGLAALGATMRRRSRR